LKKAYPKDTASQPPNIAEAERWSEEHRDAAAACERLMPLPPWGEDRANPQFGANLHEWVQCMNGKGLSIAETPENPESPWRYRGTSTVPAAENDKIVADCEQATMGKSDK
jgi:hypothetical protein